MAPLFAVGDVHGHRDALARLLRTEGLIDAADRWSGADARVWLVGDLFDRGPDGIGATELVMRLEAESEGRLGCLLGNHDLMIRAVDRCPGEPAWPDGTTFRELWLINGGRIDDLRRLTDEHRAWLDQRPALALDGTTLFVHADSDQYLRYGGDVGSINAAFQTVARQGGAPELSIAMDVLSDRAAFYDPTRLERFLGQFGATRVVHGHTPIAIATGRDASEVTAPLVYAGGRAINVDHCLFGGGPGFVVRLDG